MNDISDLEMICVALRQEFALKLQTVILGALEPVMKQFSVDEVIWTQSNLYDNVSSFYAGTSSTMLKFNIDGKFVTLDDADENDDSDPLWTIAEDISGLLGNFSDDTLYQAFGKGVEVVVFFTKDSEIAVEINDCEDVF